MRIFDIAHTRAQKLLSSGAPVFLTVNPVEYHGPHLSLHNDRLISEGLVRDLHERLTANHDWPLLEAADLELGVEPVAGPGARKVPFSNVRKVVNLACNALADFGAQRVVLVTFHGNPFHNLALEAGVRTLKKRGVQALSPFNFVLNELVELDPAGYAGAYEPIADPVEREQLINDMPRDFHAGYFETSMALHYAPESVSPDYTQLPPCPRFDANSAVTALSKVAKTMGATRLAKELEFVAIGLAWFDVKPFPGYTTSPHRANETAGAFFAEHIVSQYTTLAEDVFAGKAESPPPIMAWLETLRLGGLVGP